MYSLVFSEEALAEMRGIEPAATRRLVAAGLQRLALEPDTPGLTDMVDADGRVNRIGIFGTVACVFWTEHALRRVRILMIRQMAE